MPDLTPYGWTRDQMAICVAVVHGRTEDEVIDGYGGEPAGAQPASFDSAWDRAQDGDSILFVGGAGEAVLAVEDNGFEGSRAEVLRELGFRTEDRYPEGVDAADVDLDDIDHDWQPRCLALLAAVTGVRVTPDLLAGRLRAVPLVPLPETLYADESIGHRAPEVGTALRAAADDPDRLRRAALATARAMLAVAGLADEPLLVAALQGGTPGEVDRRSELGRRLGRLAVEGRRASLAVALSRGDPADHRRAMWRLRAGQAVRAALTRDPAVAAWAAATAGGVDLPEGAPVRQALLDALAGA